MTRFIGIDPGLAGGVAVLEPGPPAAVTLHRTPTVALLRGTRGRPRREYDVPGMRALLLDACQNGAAIALEHAGARPQQGTASTYRTGVGWGLWYALAVTTGCPIHVVTPLTWKRHAQLVGQDKRASRLRAAQRFPVVGSLTAADEGPAEALLMAAWLAAERGG